MIFEYFPANGTLYIALHPGLSADAEEVATDVILVFDASGNVIGFAIERSKFLPCP